MLKERLVVLTCVKKFRRFEKLVVASFQMTLRIETAVYLLHPDFVRIANCVVGRLGEVDIISAAGSGLADGEVIRLKNNFTVFILRNCAHKTDY